jgi:E3 ubiquitin-protein ligase DOA10
MINPCNCTGSSGSIHVSCLRHWLATRANFIIVEEDGVIAIKKQAFDCEICKTPVVKNPIQAL